MCPSKKEEGIELDEQIGRAICSSWHLGLAAMGAIEYRAHRSRAMRVLALGFCLFHVDATINDLIGRETYLKRALRYGVRKFGKVKV